MDLISFPRIGLDGKTYSKADIEQMFVTGVVGEISSRLGTIKTKSCREKKAVKWLQNHLEYILLADPIRLERLKNLTDRMCPFGPKGVKRTKDFKSEILNAFNYEYYRGKHLPQHAERLNVKTCCYCNMNYTLLIEEKKARAIAMTALLQFDHFYDKAQYPHLSMSMYNLIPSCATCNQGKPRSGVLPRYFNPYHASLFELYKFRIKDPMQLYLGVSHPEKIEVECKGTTGKDVAACDTWFHLSAKYSVHKDIVQEVFDKAREYPYYAYFNNFKFLNEGSNYPLRLLLGVYTDTKEMNRRPMSKFITDMWEQALLFHHKY